MDEPTRSDAPVDGFRIARKGYDRQQVDAHVTAAARRIGSLEHRIQELEAGMSELGLNRPSDLATELDLVGEEVKRILAEARLAAEQMRSRAADDAARWRAEADAESREIRESARSVAYATRRSVWENGTEMLGAAVSEGEALVEAATERALFVQAEAEREASRLTGDARREREEVVRAGREEAERLVASGRQESESMVSAAQRQADAAQERARALEVRRTELMAELESARATIAGVEPQPAPTPDPVDDETPSVDNDTDTFVPDDDAGSHWPDDEGSVKIVSANRVMNSGPVDADEMVAEVQALRGSPVAGRPSPVGSPEPEPTSPSPDSSSDNPPTRGEVRPSGGRGGHAPDVEDEPALHPEPALAPEPVPEPESVPEPEPAPEPQADSPLSSDIPPPQGEVPPPAGGGSQAPDVDEKPAPRREPVQGPESEPELELEPDPVPEPVSVGEREPEPDPERVPEPDPERVHDPLAGLFARLREPEPAVSSDSSAVSLSSDIPPPQGEVPPPGGGGGQASTAPASSSDTPPRGAGDQASTATDASSSDSARDPETTSPAAVAAVLRSENERGLSEAMADPFALRERLLLPVQNRALRTVKRHLVEAQNRALEELRLTDGWEPDTSIVSEEVVEALVVLARESMVAGFAAAAEMTGADQTPQPGAVEPGDPSVDFGAALVAAAQGSVARSRESGAGHRETGSSLSRVFRSWRTDDAERRVQFASRAAYHIGLTAALAELGTTGVAVVVSGRSCPACPESKGPWMISDGPPAGTTLPPARLECSCTIVPSP